MADQGYLQGEHRYYTDTLGNLGFTFEWARCRKALILTLVPAGYFLSGAGGGSGTGSQNPGSGAGRIG